MSAVTERILGNRTKKNSQSPSSMLIVVVACCCCCCCCSCCYFERFIVQRVFLFVMRHHWLCVGAARATLFHTCDFVGCFATRSVSSASSSISSTNSDSAIHMRARSSDYTDYGIHVWCSNGDWKGHWVRGAVQIPNNIVASKTSLIEHSHVWLRRRVIHLFTHNA